MADVKAQSRAVGGGRPSEEHIVNLVFEFVGDPFAIVGHRVVEPRRIPAGIPKRHERLPDRRRGRANTRDAGRDRA